MKRFRFILVLALAAALFAGCGNTSDREDASENAASSDTQEDETASQSDLVASPEEMASPTDVIDDNLTPVYGDELKDGVYNISVLSSSSMFNITSCELTVSNGSMTAVMTMGGTGYLYVFMGTGEEAIAADSGDYIPFEENEDGGHTFTVPVEALDKATDCAAFSKNKEKWYDRQLVFETDGLPSDAFVNSRYETAESLNLEDGVYTVSVSLDGGSGKASVESPAKLTVTDKAAVLTVVWSSSNYDYMIVEGEKYLPVSGYETSAFEIPVTGFDYNMPVSADTTAMSTPHEIEYTLFLDSSTIEAAE